ncbi:hypothetical protein QEM13_001887 [Pseudomonas putida]|nr:hypothetical protein [Pseudomonas putida]
MRFQDQRQKMAVFYAALDATLKALSHDRRLRFTVGTHGEADPANTVRCRQLPLFPEAVEVAWLRGRADRKAVRQRFGDPLLFLQCGGQPERLRLHEGMEQLRAEYRASRRLEGVRQNLATLVPEAPADRVDAVLAYVRCALTQRSPQPSVHSEMAWLVDRAIASLMSLWDDPQAFHRQVATLAGNLLLDAPVLVGEQADQGTEQPHPMHETSSLHLQTDPEGQEREQSPSEGLADEHHDDSGPYKVYDRALDQELAASDLASPKQLAEYRERLDQALRNARVSLSRLAGRLFTSLSTNTPDEWQTGYDDGEVDTARLERRVIDPLFADIYRRQHERPRPDTQVTLLIDNSGSMRGSAITLAALCADMLTRTLERCGVVVEVLGFTTRFWKGGESFQDWTARGRAKNPGRMNSVRHIVYKAADSSWRRSRSSLALMLDEGLLKENIDGEALLWAAKRMASRPQSRRILVVISDGAPRDEATSKANGDHYLSEHLQAVIAQLERRRDLELLAIGIGHDVSAYYRHAIVIPDAKSLGDVLVSELCALFATHAPARAGRNRSSRWADTLRSGAV